MTFDEYVAVCRRMTEPWPSPTPEFIVHILLDNYNGGVPAFRSAGAIRGELIVRGYVKIEPPTRRNLVFDTITRS